MAGELEVGTLSGRIELEDRWTNVLGTVGGSIEKFEDSWKEAGQTILNQATAFFTAEAAIEGVKEAVHLAVETLEELTLKGAAVADVEENFNHLNETAGRLGSTLLNSLKQGTHDTITDFELMKTANQDLAAGMSLTDAQFKTLSQGAFALAQATGGDVKTALDTMNDAMLTGRTRAIAMLTGKIDLAAAEENFAKKLGVTVDHLSAEGKLQAARAAILDSVGAATKRLGEQTDGLDERVAQAQTAWHNFEEDLGKTVATSPVLMAGLDGIRDALFEAFGGKSDDLVKSIAHEIDNAAITTLEFAKTAVDGVALVGIEWNALKVVIGTIEQGIRVITIAAEEVLLALMKIANFASGGLAFNDWIKSTEADLDRLYENLSEGEVKIRGYKASQDDWAVSTGHLNDAITKIEDKMKAAQKAQQDGADAAKAGAEASKQATQAANEHATATANQGLIIKQTADEAKKLADAQAELASSGKTWQETVARINPDIAEQVKQFLAAGVSASALQIVYHLTAAQVTALGDALKDQTKQQELQTKAMEDSKVRWTEYRDLVVSISGTTQEKQQADIDKWVQGQIKAHQDAKTDTKDFYDWVAKMSDEMVVRNDQARLTEDVHSKAHFEKLAQDAKEAYDFAQSHADQFTDAYIADLGKTAEMAQTTADAWSSSLGGSLDGVTKKVKSLEQEYQNLQGFAYQGAKTIDQFTIDSTPGGADALLDQLAALSRSPALDPKNVHTFADQQRYVTATAEYNALEAAYTLLKSQAKRKHSFAEGGVGDFGEGTLAVLHGKEAIIPLSQPGGPLAGGNITNVFHVNGTGAQVAQQVSDHIMRTLKQGRQFGSA